MDLDLFTDSQLMVLFAHGRKEAFDLLFTRHRDRVYRLALRMTGDGADAEEVVQETFIRVARAASRYQPTAAFTTWLHRIAHNRCLTLCERRGRHNLVPLPLDLAEAASPSPTPHEALRAWRLADTLERHVASLDLPLRSAFVLCVLEGMAYQEAAEVLESPVGTVKTHVHRARAELRRKLARRPVAGVKREVKR